MDDENGYTEDTTVRRDQRKEDTESLVESRGDLLQDDLDHLYECGDDEDEGDRLHVLHPQRL